MPTDQVVTGLLPHEPPDFQTPAALALLSDSVCVVVTGQRGVGMTQVAAAYARQRVRDGWLVAWTGGETDEQIKAGIVEPADRLSLYRPENSAEVTAARVRDHLQTRPGRALLVFDNVVSLDSIKPYLPSVGDSRQRARHRPHLVRRTRRGIGTASRGLTRRPRRCSGRSTVPRRRLGHCLSPFSRTDR